MSHIVDKDKYMREVAITVIGRSSKLCNFMEWGEYKIIYKRTPDGKTIIHNPSKYLIGYLESQGVIMPPDILVKEEFKEASDDVKFNNINSVIQPAINSNNVSNSVSNSSVVNNAVNRQNLNSNVNGSVQQPMVNNGQVNRFYNQNGLVNSNRMVYNNTNGSVG